MAKKKSVNKAKLIKDAMAANPEATPIEIAKKLSKHKITAAYVSNVKTTMGKKKKKTAKKTTKKAARKTTKKPVSDRLSLSDLVKASRLAEELGSVEKAQEMLNALTKIK